MKKIGTIEFRESKDGHYLVEMDYETFRLFLESARHSQKGRRGLSSRKVRVRKKIVTEEIRLAVLKGIELMKRDGEI